MHCELHVSGQQLQIVGEMTVQCAESVRAQWLELADGAPVRLDLSGVTEIDTAGLQLLLSARRAAAARGRVLTIVAASEAVREVLELTGQGALEGLSLVASGS